MALDCLVVGAGTVGTELARQLRNATGLDLVLTARSEESVARLTEEGFRAEVLDLRDLERVRSRVADFSHLAFCAAPSGGSQRGEIYDRGVRALAEGARESAHLVLSSSTGVYAEDEGAWVDESSPLDDGERAASLRAGEQATLDRGGCVLRFSGLVGPGRGPQRALERLSGSEQEDRWLNLVHVGDAARALRWAIETGARGVYNVSGPPMRRSELYTPLVRAAGLPAIEWSPFEGRGYRVDASAYVEASGIRPLAIDPAALVGSALPGGQRGAGQGDG